MKPTYIKVSVRDYSIVPFNSLFLFESVEEAIRQLLTQVKYPVNHFILSRLLKGASVKAFPKGITTVISAVMLNKIQMSVEPMYIALVLNRISFLHLLKWRNDYHDQNITKLGMWSAPLIIQSKSFSFKVHSANKVWCCNSIACMVDI